MIENLVIENLPAWATAAGTLLLALVAVFQDQIRARLRQPRLELSIDVANRSDCHETFLTRHDWQGDPLYSKCYYFRLWIKNIKNRGNQRAELVEVFAERLLKQRADGSFEPVDSFLPMNLRWAHIGKIYFPSISPDMGKHCDLGHIIDPQERHWFSGEDISGQDMRDQTIFSLDLMVKPNTLSHLMRPGKYRLDVVVAAANATPTRETLEMNLTGRWFDDPEQMLSEAIGIRVL